MQPKDIHGSCLVRVEPPDEAPFTSLTSLGGVIFLNRESIWGSFLEHPGSERKFTKDEVLRKQKAWRGVNLRASKLHTDNLKRTGWRRKVLEAAGSSIEQEPTLSDLGRTKFYFGKKITYGNFRKAVQAAEDACGYAIYSYRAPSLSVRTWDEDAVQEELDYWGIKVKRKVRFK